MTESPSADAAPAKKRGVLHYIGIGLSWGLLGFVALVAILVIVVPAVTRSTPYTILTSSMVPTMPPGTLVIVKPIDPQEIRIGTVVTYQLASGKPIMVTHRVVKIIEPNLPGGEPSFVTKGDANSVPDEKPVRHFQIKGAVWYTVPLIGWVNNLVNGDLRAVVIPLVAIALFGYAGYLVVSHQFEKRKKRREAAALAAVSPAATDVPDGESAS